MARSNIESAYWHPADTVPAYDYCPDCHSECRVQDIKTRELTCRDCNYVEAT